MTARGKVARMQLRVRLATPSTSTTSSVSYRDGLGLTEHGVTFEDPDGVRLVLVPEPWDPAS